jgi:hypothetical protein
MERTVHGGCGLVAAVPLLLTACLKLNPEYVDATDGGASEPCDDAAIRALDCGEAGGCSSWCDPSTWGGSVPDATTDVLIPAGKMVTMDCDAIARTVEIAAGGGLRADRQHSSTLLVHGNMIVRGRLDYGTFDDRVAADASAQLVFTGMDDRSIVGTPSDPDVDVATPSVEPSDVGLWVVDDGVVTAAGQRKRSWTSLVADAARGERRIDVAESNGWRAGDQIFVSPTSPIGITSYTDFDDGTIAGVSGSTIGLAEPLAHEHLGCEDCLRRAEVGNLTRNVVIRSLDATAHAHVFVAGAGVVQLDSVELRWLGPEPRCGGENDPPAERRKAIYFYRQGHASNRSFLCHTSIWGGANGFYAQEGSHGIAVQDVVGYDAPGTAFHVFNQDEGCTGACDPWQEAPRGTVLTHVLAARVAVPRRPADCERIAHSFAAFALGGGDDSGCDECVVAGLAQGIGHGLAGFRLTALDTRDFTFRDNRAHHIDGFGVFMRETSCKPREIHGGLSLWTLERAGFHWERSGCQSFADVTIFDSVGPSLEYSARPADERPRIAQMQLDDLHLGEPARPTLDNPTVFRDLSFTGTRDVAITQRQETCGREDDEDPPPEQFEPTSEEEGCIAVSARFENVTFDAGVQRPLWFGWPGNFHTQWTVVDFDHPAHPLVPRTFTLHRRDNQVEGGCYHEGFDAWLVPGNDGSSCE